MTLSAASTRAPLTYAFGPFVLDVGNRRLLRDGEPAAITARVFDILVALVERRGEAVDKDVLMTRVWGDIAVEEGNLARAISTLRKVLGDSPDDPRYIFTLPGRGYTLEERVAVAWRRSRRAAHGQRRVLDSAPAGRGCSARGGASFQEPRTGRR